MESNDEYGDFLRESLNTTVSNAGTKNKNIVHLKLGLLFKVVFSCSGREEKHRGLFHFQMIPLCAMIVYLKFVRKKTFE
jgi:hypothetical protein